MSVSPLAEHFQRDIAAVCDVIRRHKTFLIVGHVRPDGDCLGSQLGLALGLRDIGKEVRVYSPGPMMRHFKFVPHIELVETALDMSFNPDATIFVDCGGIDRAGADFEPRGCVLNIDHHVSNNSFGDAAYVNTGATAAAEQVFDVLAALGAPMGPDIANSLYLGIMADSGSFRFSNTNARTFEVVGELVRHGANPSWIASMFFENQQAPSLWLKGQVLSHLHFELDGRFCWAEITQEMYDQAGGEDNEPEGLVSELRSVEGTEVSILIHEISSGGARAGIRSRGNWDVNIIASELGGGGHRNASGCYIRGAYPEVRDRILEVARKHLALAPAQQRATGTGH